MDYKVNKVNNGYPLRLKAYSTYMDSIRGQSVNTIEGYCLDLMQLFKFLKYQKNLVPKDINFDDIDVSDIDDKFLNEITLSDLYDFLVFSKKYLKNGSSTIARKIASIRGFYRFLFKKLQVISQDVSTELDKPKIGKRKIKYLSLDESEQLLNGIKGTNVVRDKCIITLFLNCGMRLSELCSIQCGDIKNDTIRIIGKGDKERFVYLNQMCIDAINDYLPVREQVLKARNKKATALFISNRGCNIARRTVQEVVERQLKYAGVYKKGLSTHKLRHTAATLLYKYGNVDILVLKDILGHEDVSTTQIYTHTDNDMIRNAVGNNPLNNLKKEDD